MAAPFAGWKALLQALDHSQDGVGSGVLDRGLRFVEVDAALSDLHGLPVAEHLGCALDDLLPTLAPQLIPLALRVLTTGEPVSEVVVEGSTAAAPGPWLASFHPIRTRRGTTLAVEYRLRHQERAQASIPTAAHPEASFHEHVLATLYDAVIAVDHDELVTYWGPGAERLYGRAAADARGQPLTDLYRAEWLVPTDAEVALAALSDSGFWSGEQIHRLPDGGTLRVALMVTILPGRAQAPTRMFIVIRDMTAEVDRERLRAIAAASTQQAAEEGAILDTLVDTAPIGLALLDRDLRFLKVNAHLAEINGLPVDAHLGHTVREVLPALADMAEPLLRQVLATGEPILDLELVGETPAQPGETRIWRESFYPIHAAGGQLLGVGVIAREITEFRRMRQALDAQTDQLRHSEEQLRLALHTTTMRTEELAARTLELERANAQLAQEIAERVRAEAQAQASRDQLYQTMLEVAVAEERARIARDLHDAVTQTLFSASLIAEALPVNVKRSPQQAQRGADELCQLTRGALAEMRTLLYELRPTAFEEKPLSELLSALCTAFTNRIHIPVTFAMESVGTLQPAEVQMVCYRAVQEALNNVWKHARATTASVRAISTTERVEIEVTDDGEGFDQAAGGSGFRALGVLHERAVAIDAMLDVVSQPGKGTTVRLVWIPL